ncbi:hypothetical protein D020_1378B, partial [Vibrio parahaemolyticus SBR10290]
YKQR